MANFSAKERFVASLLSATPKLKQIIKKAYILFNSIIYRKPYLFKILNGNVGLIRNLFEQLDGEAFFGYYDKKPISSTGLIISHYTKRSTALKPSVGESIDILLSNLHGDDIKKIGESNSYTWQQGCRTQWLDDDTIIYNNYEDEIYKSVVYSISQDKIVKKFDFPVQDSFGTDFFISINYNRIMRLRPDYGYRNTSLLDDNSMRNIKDDGIWKVDYKTGIVELLHSLQSIVDVETKEIFALCLHKVNHVMINESGKKMIFIHRFYQGQRRYDRLICSDFVNMKVLVDDSMVSHCCWVDEQTILGYFRYEGKNGYYFCNVNTGEITSCNKMTNLHVGDGHPSCYKNWIVFDSYPDKSRMQHLYLYNMETEQIYPLLELFQDVKYMGESRCDLHPRFSKNGELVFFDTVYLGKRTHSYIDVSNIVSV